VTQTNNDVKMLTATSTNGSFVTAVSSDRAVVGAARNSVIGHSPDQHLKQRAVERPQSDLAVTDAGPAPGTPAGTADPLTPLQWDMQLIHAPEAHEVLIGDHRTKVGVMDTGVDGTHPDIAPNFDSALSRNFTTDIPAVDGPCEVPSCVDPPNVDDDGHGTHVAGTIASPRNGIGIEGVAPGVDIVNVRAGQDSGFFFIGPFVNAMTYAADVGLDVVNMSFYIDPWLYNCAANPADSPEAQLEQRTIIQATNRALRYARRHGVTLIAALGNEHTDLGNPTSDATSPDYPPKTNYPRTVDNSCIDLPTEGPGVIGVSSIGPSTTKADYSNWGIEQTDVSAPGGYSRDYFGTPRYRTVANLVLAPYPLHLALTSGDLNPDGTPNTPFVVADCSSGTCSYYQYLQGTSMAAPHAVGVAALIVAANGEQGDDGRDFGLDPNKTEKLLYRTATKTPCPPGGVLDYPDRDATWTAVCEGTLDHNGFYGHGIVDALAAAQTAEHGDQHENEGAG
jgi:subtilisin family serine protease